MTKSHRKSLSVSINITISEYCPSFCDPTTNDSGFCPQPCLSLCPPICQYPISSHIHPPIPHTSPKHHLNKFHALYPFFIVTFTVIATLLFFACCYAFYMKFYSSNRRSEIAQPGGVHEDFFDENHGPVLDHPIWYINTIGLQPSVIGAITLCEYKKDDGLIEATECSVCLNEFQEGDDVRLLPKCTHAFHVSCIDTWLRSHTNCPMCRAGIVSNMADMVSPRPNEDNLGSSEETHVAVSDNREESGSEREDKVEEDSETRIEDGRNGCEASKEEVEMQPIRRSVSMDSSSLSKICIALTDLENVKLGSDSESQLEKSNESNTTLMRSAWQDLVGSSSMARSIQYLPTSMKRSMSCRTQNSVLPF